MRKVYVAIGVLGVLLIAYSCGSTASGSGSAASECRQLASDRYGAGVDDVRSTAVTFTDGDFIKGTINARGAVHGHWECRMESDGPVITFYSPAGSD